MALAVDHPRTVALAILAILRNAGHVAYFAGGCVRDELLGLEPIDFDIATDATPARVLELFRVRSGFRCAEVGVSFGVVIIRRKGVTTEVATFREDGSYADHRRPESVVFSSPENDARRRDFTINALFLDPCVSAGGAEKDISAGNGVIDYVGGVDDLRAGVIRAVGNPAARLEEDHLRALRAVRFAARFGFVIERGTEDAIRRDAAELAGVSRERIGDEVRGMLTRSRESRARAIAMLSAFGLDVPIFGSTGALGQLAAADIDMNYPVALAAWAIDRGVCIEREADVRAWVASWRGALCLSNADRDAMAGVLASLAVITGPWKELPVAQQKRAAAAPMFDAARVLLGQMDADLETAIALRIGELAMIGGGLWPERFVDGQTLLELGATPCSQFGRVLDEVFDAQLEGRVDTKDQAERLAMELWAASGVE